MNAKSGKKFLNEKQLLEEKKGVLIEAEFGLVGSDVVVGTVGFTYRHLLHDIPQFCAMCEVWLLQKLELQSSQYFGTGVGE